LQGFSPPSSKEAVTVTAQDQFALGAASIAFTEYARQCKTGPQCAE